jgi:hypothetical protein
MIRPRGFALQEPCTAGIALVVFSPEENIYLGWEKNTEWGQHFPTPVALVTTVPPNPMTEATATRQFGTQSPSPS